MDTGIEIQDYILRLVVAYLLGGTIGFERQWQQKSAGLRTNTLVAIGAASFVLLSILLHGVSGGDPARISAQIVTGIGFLGAGVIMRDGLTIRGLNTAATIWCSAAVGALAGMGYLTEASITAGAVIVTHLTLRPVSLRLGKLSAYKKTDIRQRFYLISISCPAGIEIKVREYLMEHFEKNDQLLLRSISRSESASGGKESSLKVEVSAIGEQENHLEGLITKMTRKYDLSNAGWRLTGEEPEY